MATRSLDVMRSRPGIYIVFTPCLAVFIEVDKEGNSYQLRKDTLQRDQQLEDGKWNVQAITAIYGPFALI